MSYFKVSHASAKNSIHHYRQKMIPPPIPDGEISKNCTIVTGYYSIPSKYSSNAYYWWINNFMKIKSNMIIFTDSQNYEKFKSYNKENCHIILLELKDFYTSKWDNYWQHCKQIDTEKQHTTELYKVWAEKANFLKLGADLNPFNSELFFWVDIGCIRDGTLANYCQYFPNYKKLKEYDLNKFFLSSITPFQNSDENFIDGISHIFRNTSNNSGPKDIVRIQGGFFGGNIDNINKWFDLYYSELEFFHKQKQFGGKDQYVMANIYLKNKDLFNLLQPKDIYLTPYIHFNKWFSFLHRFS